MTCIEVCPSVPPGVRLYGRRPVSARIGWAVCTALHAVETPDLAARRHDARPARPPPCSRERRRCLQTSDGNPSDERLERRHPGGRRPRARSPGSPFHWCVSRHRRRCAAGGPRPLPRRSAHLPARSSRTANRPISATRSASSRMRRRATLAPYSPIAPTTTAGSSS